MWKGKQLFSESLRKNHLNKLQWTGNNFQSQTVGSRLASELSLCIFFLPKKIGTESSKENPQISLFDGFISLKVSFVILKWIDFFAVNYF